MSCVCFGEVLWDILPAEKVPGGAPMNVCYHLNRLGQKASVISKIGSDEDGKALIKFLNEQDVDTSLIQTDYTQPTGTVIATQIGNEMEYDIVKPVAWDYIELSKPLLDKVSAADYFICGSLVARSEKSRNTLYQLLNVAQTKVVDINLRHPHYTKETVEALFNVADILKVNDHESKLIAGWYSDDTDFERQVSLISKKFSIPVIIITKGAAGAALLHQNSFYYNDGYKVTVADTIGSGDAFLAGFLSKYIKDALPETALDFACRIGAFIASQKGACPEYVLGGVEKSIE